MIKTSTDNNNNNRGSKQGSALIGDLLDLGLGDSFGQSANRAEDSLHD